MEETGGNIGALALLIASEEEADRVRMLLREAGLEAKPMAAACLAEGIRSADLAGAVLCDSTVRQNFDQIRLALGQQPVWSLFPFVILADRSVSADSAALYSKLGNVRILERPLHAPLLTQAVEASLHGRARQRLSGEHLAQRDSAASKLEQLTRELEERVRSRTEELRQANERLVLEAEERRSIEQRLRESEELHRFTVELGRQMVWTASPDGRILSLSPRFSELTGLDRHSDPHEGWLQVMHPDDSGQVWQFWTKLLESGEAGSTEFRMRMADGSYRTFLARAAPRRNKEGVIERWYGYTQDVEDQRRAEEQLRESEELHRRTMEMSRQIAWTADPDGRVTSVSPNFETVTGTKPVLPYPHQVVMHPEDVERVFSHWSDSRSKGEEHQAEFRLRVADGSYRTFRSRVSPLEDDRGRIVRWYGSTLDIHDQKTAEFARQSAEERYRLAAMATNDAIWDLDLTTNEIHWSETAGDVLGYPGEKLGTTSLEWWRERIHPDDRAHATESLERSVSRGKNRWSHSYRFRRASGEYGLFFDRGFIIRDGSGETTRFVGAMTDLTDRQKAEEEIRRMQAELIHVSRVSAMGTMASTLAHELNQPLTAVSNYVRGSRRLLEQPTPDRLKAIEQALEAAESGALRAGQIVRRLRELVARGTAATRPEELPKLIEDAGVLGFLDAHLLDINPRIELDPEAQWVEADRIQIQQVLINLIRNAFQAMEHSEDRDILISTKRVGGFVEVSVADRGSGISPEVRDALFSAFQGTKAEGMGIGLSISRTIIEAHGGKIWAEDREGGGTIFRFTLTASEGPKKGY